MIVPKPNKPSNQADPLERGILCVTLRFPDLFKLLEVKMPSINYREPSIGDRLFSNFLIILSLAIIVFSGFFILKQYGLIVYLSIVILTLTLLVYWHSKTRAYKCKNCGNEFEIKFRTDLVSAHFFRQKMLTCPKCHFKDYASELIKRKTI